MAQSGGRSSERLVEELLSYSPGRCLFAQSPIHAAKAQNSSPIRAGRPPVTLVARDLVPTTTVVLAFYPEPRHHLSVHIRPGIIDAAESGEEHDWHIQAVDHKSGDDASLIEILYLCSLTGAQLSVCITPEVLDTDSKALLYDEAGRSVLARAIGDLLAGTARPIRATNPLVQRSFDPRILLRLGYVLDEDADSYLPPEDVGPASDERLELLRILLELTQHFEPASEALLQLLGASAPSHTYQGYQLSNSDYGTLGAVSSFNNDQIVNRYDMQSRNDPLGVPWYLESLKQLAQQRQSDVIETRVMELVSLGTPTLGAVKDAVKKLGLDFDEINSVSDDQLLQLQIDTPSPLNDQELSLLAQFRNSQLLSQAASVLSMNYDDAHRTLGFEPDNPDVTPAQIAAAARQLASASPIGKLEARQALSVLGSVQKSPVLLGALEELSPQVPLPGPEAAYSILGASPSMEDSDVAAVFDIAVDDSATSPIELVRALKAIAKERNSKLLQSHIDPQLIDLSEDDQPPADLPVGLWNIGNTCYLNSVLQFYYTIDKVREYACKFASTEQDDLEEDAKKKVGGRVVPLREIHRSQVFVNALGKLYNQMSESRGQVWPPETLAYMALVPPQEDTEEDLAMLEKQPKEEPQEQKVVEISQETDQLPDVDDDANTDDDESKTDHQTEEAKADNQSEEIEDDDMEIVDVVDVSKKSTNPFHEVVDISSEPEEPVDASALAREKLMMALARQQDVTECIENVMFQLEAAGKADGFDPDDGEQLDLIKDLFYGIQVQSLTQIKTGAVRSKQERFSSILVDVSEGPTDVYQTLDKYFSRDVLDLGGEGPDGGVTERSVSLRRPPAILQLQVQRVQFNRETLAPYKSLHPLTFGDVVYLDRYLDPNLPNIDPTLKTHIEEAHKWRNTLGEMERQDEADAAAEAAFEKVIEWYKNYEVVVSEESQLVIDKKHNEITQRRRKRAEERSTLQQKLREHFDGFTTYGYTPHALFIHKGNVNFGHYWIYIKSETKDCWYKYNDEIVTRVEESEVLDFREGNLATPYFIVFKRTTI